MAVAAVAAEDAHGTRTGYTRDRCRCIDCRAANARYAARRRLHLVDHYQHAAILKRVLLWRLIIQVGWGGKVCDEIVMNRPVPDALIDAVYG